MSGHQRTQALHLLHDLHYSPAPNAMENLPFLVRLIAATILAKQNKALIAEIAYLRTEVDYLRGQLPARLRFTDEWRKRLARSAAAVGWERIREVATVAKGDTLRKWRRLMLLGRLGTGRGPGRPRTHVDIELTVIRLAEENPTWGQLRIRGEMMKLGVRPAARTIAAILKRHGLGPAPKRSANPAWKEFISDHLDEVVATDFLTADVWGWLGKRTVYVLFAIHLGTRRVHLVGVSENPDETFVTQTARHDTMVDVGWLARVGAKYLVHDRDTKFCSTWKTVMQQGGITLVPTPPRSPDLNPFAERWVRTVKRECLRRVCLIGVSGLRRALTEYISHYNETRPHQSMGNVALTGVGPPAQISVSDFRAGKVRCRTACGGVVRDYYRAA